MAKRRAEDAVLLHESPSKRRFRSLCSVDLQLEESVVVPPAVGFSQPSLLALLGSRCKKRKYLFEEQEKLEEAATVFRKSTNCCDSRKHAARGLTSGSFQDHRSSNNTHTSTKKVPQEEVSTGLETSPPKATNKVTEDSNTEDCTYNSFQYWRVPLPELDLSLLEETSDPSVAMET